MILVFLGPPFSGKGTQAEILSKELGISVFSMGAIIRDAYAEDYPRAKEGYENYSMKGLHLPNEIKFPWLIKKIDGQEDFILDNYPGNQEDLDTMLNYLAENSLQIDKVFCVNISIEEMKNRMIQRGRPDDNPEIVLTRREIQDKDRQPVLEYFRQKGLLAEINGEGTIDAVHAAIKGELNDKN
jgi:adenylate kinase